MAHKHRITIVILGLCGVLWILLNLASTSSSTTKVCEEYPPYSGNEKCTAHYLVNVPFIRVTHFLNNDSGLITGIATAFLTLITAFLVRNTRQQNETTRAQLRANVFAMALNSYWIPDPAGGPYSWRLGPRWFNTGETPTKGLRIHSICHIRNTPLPEGFNFDYPTPDVGVGGIIAPKANNPGGQVPKFPGYPISPQEIIAAQGGQGAPKFIYLYGWAKYFDIFPGTPEHTTTYCWLIAPQGDPLTFRPDDPAHPLTFNYFMHTEGSSFD
jgi:hypothetical protein